MAHSGGFMTDEDEAFEDLAKRQGDWGLQGSRKHQILRYVENKETTMTPTPKLRFVERVIQIPVEPRSNFARGKTVRILQQWWKVENINDAVHNNILDGEWRDIPLEQEA
jgi:hypothetical protein